jgi:hypothetical protein
MATKIKDEFSELPISRERKYQLRMQSKHKPPRESLTDAARTSCPLIPVSFDSPSLFFWPLALQPSAFLPLPFFSL